MAKRRIRPSPLVVQDAQIVSVRSGAATSKSVNLSIPSNLPKDSKCFIQTLWSENAVVVPTVSFAGGTLVTLLTANNPGTYSTVVRAMYEVLNPTSGTQAFQVSNASGDYRCLVVQYAILLPPYGIVLTNNLADSASANSYNLACEHPAPAYHMQLGCVRGNDGVSGADATNNLELVGTGLPAGASSVSTDLAYWGARRLYRRPAAHRAVVTFSASRSRSAVAAAIGG